ncbi:MAG: N-acetyltransferase family protein [Roseiarcus sp.]
MAEEPHSSQAAPAAEIAVRDADEADMPAVQRIYAHYVLNALATFEETPPTLEDMIARRRKTLDLAAPYLVAERRGQIVGYCYASAYHSRPAYRYTLEDSVYVAEGQGGQGVGSALLGALIARCEGGPWRQMLAIIGDSANRGSIALHRRFGFTPVGTLRSVGFKFGRWVDTPIMQRALGPGDGRLPGVVNAAAEPNAARSQDFLYGEDGMPN